MPSPTRLARSAAYASATTPALTRTSPTQSIRAAAPAGGILGTQRRQKMIASAANGTFSRNTQRQLTCSDNKPPTNGPKAVPMFATPNRAPIAAAR